MLLVNCGEKYKPDGAFRYIGKSFSWVQLLGNGSLYGGCMIRFNRYEGVEVESILKTHLKNTSNDQLHRIDDYFVESSVQSIGVEY